MMPKGGFQEYDFALNDFANTAEGLTRIARIYTNSEIEQEGTEITETEADMGLATGRRVSPSESADVSARSKQKLAVSLYAQANPVVRWGGW